MSATIKPVSKSAEPEFVISHSFDAPRDLVFKEWTEAERLMRWWGPKGFTIPFCRVDLRPGGVWHYCMRSPEGRDYYEKSVYREIVAPERIVGAGGFVDTKGNPVSPSAYGMPDFPNQMSMTVTFVERDGKTTVTVHQSVPASVAKGYGAEERWNQSFDRLADDLAKEKSLFTSTRPEKRVA